MSEPQDLGTRYELQAIGVIRTPFREAAGTPIQPVYATEAEGKVLLEACFAGALDVLDGTPVLTPEGSGKKSSCNHDVLRRLRLDWQGRSSQRPGTEDPAIRRAGGSAKVAGPV